ncbi:hypothetical protein SK128_013180 [Halocaridina rubra]|uniref:Uncharacterized protein n=1 Tax=Halocaridina rubra TaxID=373956 RepID=A0AAN9A1U0_HALRR
MKNKTETLISDEMSKPLLEGGGGGLGVKVEKPPPSPPPQSSSPPPSSPPPHSGALPPGARLSSTPTPPSQASKIKCESPVSVGSSHASSPRPVTSPPAAGPGAEIKGKPGTPLPSGCPKGGTVPRPGSAGGEEPSKGACGANATSGGRLTFFKEGRFVLELSHRTEMGAPAGWVAVKSKTYWPPPSSATTTTTQHPLRHDTPTSQSDECSSLNSSPWTNEHVRKQLVPRCNKAPIQSLFMWQAKSATGDLKRKRRGVRRNPFVYHFGCSEALLLHKSRKRGASKTVKSEICFDVALSKKLHLENELQSLEEKLGMKVDRKVSVKVLFEKPVVSTIVEPLDPTFVSPRKRYLRLMEDQDSIHRKKLHSGASCASQLQSSELPSSSSSPAAPSFPNRSAIISQTSSAYSIDSILNNESVSRKNDSFLRTLLKPESKPSTPQPKSAVKDRISSEVISNMVKKERAERTDRGVADRLEHANAAYKDRKEPLSDLSRLTAERYNMPGYGSLGNLASLYGLNLIDPRYMMLPSLAQPMSSQQTEMAVAAAAAAALYPLGPLHPSLANAQYSHLLSAGLSSGYPSNTAAAFGHLLRPQPQPSRLSPHHHPLAHSPSPKPPPQAPSTPASPHLSRGASPRGASSPWQPPPPAHPFSPQKPLASPPSPPTQGL